MITLKYGTVYSTLTLNNSTVSGNTTKQGNGGGIENLGTLTLSNSTVSGNMATSEGGGIFIQSSTSLDGLASHKLS